MSGNNSVFTIKKNSMNISNNVSSSRNNQVSFDKRHGSALLIPQKIITGHTELQQQQQSIQNFMANEKSKYKNKNNIENQREYSLEKCKEYNK